MIYEANNHLIGILSPVIGILKVWIFFNSIKRLPNIASHVGKSDQIRTKIIMSEIVIIAIFLKRSGKAKYRISNVTWSRSLTIKAQPKKNQPNPQKWYKIYCPTYWLNRWHPSWYLLNGHEPGYLRGIASKYLKKKNNKNRRQNHGGDKFTPASEPFCKILHIWLPHDELTN